MLNDTWDTGSEMMMPQISFPLYVVIWVVFGICLPLLILAIGALLFEVGDNHSTPIYIINILISDLIHICSMIAMVTSDDFYVEKIFHFIHAVSVLSNIGFMMCIALERYLVIAWPLWYRFRRSIKVSVLVCVVVWLVPVVPVIFMLLDTPYIFPIFLLLPFPVLIISFVGTLKSLSTVISVDKRQVVRTLVLVLLIYSLLFLPFIISNFIYSGSALGLVGLIFVMINPIADLALYVFLSKGSTEKLLALLCRCRRNIQRNRQHVVNVGGLDHQ